MTYKQNLKLKKYKQNLKLKKIAAFASKMSSKLTFIIKNYAHNFTLPIISIICFSLLFFPNIKINASPLPTRNVSNTYNSSQNKTHEQTTISNTHKQTTISNIRTPKNIKTLEYNIPEDDFKLKYNTLSYSDCNQNYAFLGNGTQSNPYKISNSDNLTCLSWLTNHDIVQYTNKFWEQTANIDLEPLLKTQTDSFIPIGTWKKSDSDSPNGHKFQGKYNGQNYSINNIYISPKLYPDQDTNNFRGSHIGLFGNVSNGELKNITLDNPFVQAVSSVGSLIGVAVMSNFQNIKVNNPLVTVTDFIGRGMLLNGSASGSIFGNVQYSSISDIYSKDGIVGGFQNVGGIAGMFEASTANNVYNSSDVYGVASKKATVALNPKVTGGIFGETAVGNGFNTQVTHISNTVNCGNIYTNDVAGGIVAQIQPGYDMPENKIVTVENSYNSGDINIIFHQNSHRQFGGIIGIVHTSIDYFSTKVNLVNVYNSGNFSTNYPQDSYSESGGIIGKESSKLNLENIVNTSITSINHRIIGSIDDSWHNMHIDYNKVDAYYGSSSLTSSDFVPFASQENGQNGKTVSITDLTNTYYWSQNDSTRFPTQYWEKENNKLPILKFAKNAGFNQNSDKLFSTFSAKLLNNSSGTFNISSSNAFKTYTNNYLTFKYSDTDSSTITINITNTDFANYPNISIYDFSKNISSNYVPSDPANTGTIQINKKNDHNILINFFKNNQYAIVSDFYTQNDETVKGAITPKTTMTDTGINSSFEITPKKNYYISQITFDNINVPFDEDTSDGHTIIEIGSSLTNYEIGFLVISFEVGKYSIEANVSTDTPFGTVSGYYTNSDVGSDLSFVARSNSGYHFSHATLNGVIVPDNFYKFSDNEKYTVIIKTGSDLPKGHSILTVYFSENTYTINYQLGKNRKKTINYKFFDTFKVPYFKGALQNNVNKQLNYYTYNNNKYYFEKSVSGNNFFESPNKTDGKIIDLTTQYSKITSKLLKIKQKKQLLYFYFKKPNFPIKLVVIKYKHKKYKFSLHKNQTVKKLSISKLNKKLKLHLLHSKKTKRKIKLYFINKTYIKNIILKI